jgi:hypothetical protein
MSKNIKQVYDANPITSNTSTDLIYVGQSPYGVGNDAAITYANFAVQFSSPLISGTGSASGKGGGASTASSTNSFAWGNVAVSSGANAIALGDNAQATFLRSIAIGRNSTASGSSSVALGPTSTSSAANATAVGLGSQATAGAATAIGSGSQANGTNSAAVGISCQANGTNSIAIGQACISTLGVTIGIAAVSTNSGSTVISANNSAATDTASNQLVLASQAGIYFAPDNNSTVALKLETTGQVNIQNAGTGLTIKSGSNCKVDTAVLVGGTVTVSNTSVTANSLILLTTQVAGGVQGILSIGTVTAGTSFDINSSSVADTSTVGYMIVEKG